MKRSGYIFLIVLLAGVLALLVWYRRQRIPFAAPTTSSSSRPTSEPSKEPVASSAEQTQSAPPAKTPPAPVVDKKTKMQAIWAATNARSQDYIGHIVDQSGQPVAGADVTGNLSSIQGFDVGEKERILRTTSDGNGDFQFVGISGSSLGVVVNKSGYESAPNNLSVKLPAGPMSASNRAIITLWKLRGPEPMVWSHVYTKIPCDGKPVNFDLLTGDPTREPGDITVTLTRTPVDISRGSHFDWRATLVASGGGLIEMADIYPNEAPADGYRDKIEISMPASGRDWSPQFERSYYWRGRNGKIFGRVQLKILADFEPPPTLFSIVVIANPAGSRNLEYDESKRIR